MIAAKHFDPVMGVDIHIIQPPGPVPPIPVPHPFVGMIFDVFDYMPFIGATVFINGVPRATAGTEAKNIPHFPIGGMFVMPPGNEGEIFMGSATVLADGEPLSRMSMPVLSCQSVGMMAPMRKKVKTTSMVLPTSMVLSVPMGRPVMVGGPPTISMMAMGMRGLMGGLGKLGKLKRIQKLKKAAKKKLDDLKPKKAKNKAKGTKGQDAKKTKCEKDPVDMVTGRVIYSGEDFSLSGSMPLVWERHWYSDSDYDGLLGHGVSCNHDLAIHEDVENAAHAVRLPDGRLAIFPLDIDLGGEEYNRVEKYTLRRAADGRLSTFDHAARVERTFMETEPGLHRVEKMTDASGHSILYHYDGMGGLTGLTDSAGRKVELEKDAMHRVTSITLRHRGASKKVASYTYDRKGNMTAITDALGQRTRIEYEGHLMEKKTDRNGQSFYWRYDGEATGAKCIKTWGDGGIFCGDMVYEPSVTYITDSLGCTKEYHYNERDLCTMEVDAMGGVTRHTFTDHDEPYEDIDPLGNVTGYGYDGRGNLTSIHHPDGGVSTFSYDEQDRLLLRRTPTGQYDLRKYAEGRLATVIESSGALTNYHYGEHGLMSAVSDRNGEQTLLEYDRDLNLSKAIRADGSSSLWRYDTWGRCIETSTEGRGRQHFSYDALDRVTTINQADGNRTSLEYNAYDEVTRAVDRHHRVRFSYTPLGSLNTREEGGRKVRFHYDSEEQLASIVNEQNEIYSFDRNSRGDITTERGFDGLERRYRRDLAGRVVKVQRPGERQTVYRYDKVGRILHSEHHDGTWEGYTYDLDGRLVEAVNHHGSVTLRRDESGRVICEEQEGHTVESRYDREGRRIGLSSSLGASIDMEYDAMDRLSRTTARTDSTEKAPWQADFAYNVLGQEIERVLPGGIRSETQYDMAGRPIAHKVHRHRREMRNRSYQWNVNDRLSRMTDQMNGGQVIFTHDDFGNLASAMYEDKQWDYKLPDEVGNLYRSENKKDRKYGKGGQLKEMDGHLYDYDEEGNLIAKESRQGRWEYSWYGTGMLESVSRPDGERITFEYDALGRRTAKIADGKITRFVWDGNVPLHEWTYDKKDRPQMVLDAYGFLEKSHEEPTPEVTTWVFDEGTFKPAAKIVGGESYSIVTDYLGTPVEAYASDGEQVWTAEYDIYGKRRKGTSAPLSDLIGEKCFVPFRYQGMYEDEETGLCYNRFRYYSNQEGIYLSQDPIRLAGGMPTMYSYVYDSNSGVDVFGLAGDYNQIPKIAGHQKHHIIPQSMKHPLLDKIGFDVHQSGNIVQLPTSADVDPTRTVHKGRHNAAYDNLIRSRLDAIDALDASDDIKRLHVNDVMENVGDDLRNKRIKLNCH